MSKMLELFLDTFTADDKYSRHHRENFRQQIQMHLPQKPKTFFQHSIAFLTSASHFEYLEKNDESQSLSISEINDSERAGYLNVWKVFFPATLRQSTS